MLPAVLAVVMTACEPSNAWQGLALAGLVPDEDATTGSSREGGAR